MISILMSTQNPIEKYFKKSMDSIFNQTYKDFELVLIDDGSEKPVIDFIKKQGYDINKIRYVRLEKNVGLPKALNIGLKECSGDYIARMDDDDLMVITRLEKQLNYVEQNNLVGCFCWYDNIDTEDNIINKCNISISEKEYLQQLLKRGNIFCHASLFIKKNVLEEINGYDENLRYAQDSDLYIRILNKYKMGMVKEYLLQHRKNSYRNNSYRETLSLTYALFGAMNYYTDCEKIGIKEKISIFIRLMRYYVGILRISKKKKISKEEKTND